MATRPRGRSEQAGPAAMGHPRPATTVRLRSHLRPHLLLVPHTVDMLLLPHMLDMLLLLLLQPCCLLRGPQMVGAGRAKLLQVLQRLCGVEL
jgi:hypothetical protein